MDVGIGLPTTLSGVGGSALIDWAIEGERAGLHTLATLDRLVYDNYESLTALAAAAAVTEHVRLATAILIAPLRTNTALLAKQVATVDRISGGRLTLGLAVGARPDDFTASGAPRLGRGARLTAQIEEMRRIWAGERRGFAGAIGPRPTREGGPEILLGGHSSGAIARVAATGSAWISGSGGIGAFQQGAQAVRRAWRDGGRAGAPRLLGLTYFAVGGNAERDANIYLRDYYGFAPPYAQMVLNGAAIGEQGVVDTVRAYRDAGCDELILAPCSADLAQVRLLSEALTRAGTA
ncbi:MAG TPA: LLM class flavin-dependent oxidoreductase [Pseudonocardiaceae bacterium]|nr:LLM class flavin-dependent oxidoreductase [Pseudonocardiaceae bacterium]